MEARSACAVRCSDCIRWRDTRPGCTPRGSYPLRATPEHPFFANGRWVSAGELSVGDILLEVAEDGRTVVRVPVRSIESQPGGVETFNLEVSGVHDYFAGGILVHNKPPYCSTGCL